MREDWSGFYGPAYRLMLRYADCETIPDDVWEEAVALHRKNPAGECHWEFLALGYLHLFDRTSTLDPASDVRMASLEKLFSRNHPATNWRVMVELVRCRRAGRFLAQKDIERAGLKQAGNGFLTDIPGDQSSQYHAFILYLIVRFSDPANAAMRSIVLRALDWLMACYQRYGDPSPLGRGRFQVFGYASMAALAEQAERWRFSIPASWLADIWDRIGRARSRGAISPKWDGPHCNRLWHGYNTVDDYPAFAALLTHELKPPKSRRAPKGDRALWWHPLDRYGSGLVASRRGVLLSILMSPHPPGPAGLRTLLSKALRRMPYGFTEPQIILSAQRLPGNNVQIIGANKNFDLHWDIGDQIGQFYDMTLWTPLPIIEWVTSGSIEVSHLKWWRDVDSVWSGLAFRSSRVGDLQISLKLP